MNNKLKKIENWLRVNGKADNTIKSYLPKLKDFLTKVSVINKLNIETYLLALQDTLSNGSINIYRNAICAYIDYADLDVKIPKTLPEDKTIPDQSLHF